MKSEKLKNHGPQTIMNCVPQLTLRLCSSQSSGAGGTKESKNYELII